ncbi:MAG: hypothetical protein HOW73_23995 [Polyangiaceae bacterium]|nr:hypothetical protein [Polyangiaceae bacterium]
MADGFFNVEDFVQSILSQLDRVQDALRLKAVNRPLTYALKDISLDFHVFAELDPQGNVRFRPASSNESGASTLKLGFTTITRPMIEENTVSLAATRSPRIDELGLSPDEVKRLESVGVRTAAQLNRLQSVAGSSTVSRWANVDSTRLKDVLNRARPVVDRVQVQPGPAVPPRVVPRPAPVPAPPAPPPVSRPPISAQPAPPPRPAPIVRPPIDFGPKKPIETQPAFEPQAPVPRQRIRLVGRNLMLGEDAPGAKFNDVPVSITRALDDELEVELPHDATSGTLELSFGDDDVHSIELELAPASVDATTPAMWNGDPWAPGGGT